MRIGCVALVLVALAGSAQGQTSTSSPSTGGFGAQDYARNGESDVNNWPANGAMSQQASSRQQVAAYEQAIDYSRCVARLAPKAAVGVLNADPNSADERNGMLQLTAAGRPCLAYGANPPGSFVRAGLAEALVAKAGAATTDVTPERGSAFEAIGRTRGAANRGFADYANCAVARAQEPVRALLRTKAGSKAEKAAFDAVLAETGGCAGKDKLPSAGLSPGLRSTLAESAWRWSTFAKTG